MTEDGAELPHELRGIELPHREMQPLPHRCRCIVYELEDPASSNHCLELVFEGPDVPVCFNCQLNHWGPTKTWDGGTRLFGSG